MEKELSNLMKKWKAELTKSQYIELLEYICGMNIHRTDEL